MTGACLCVVETGISSFDARMSHAPTETMTQRQPNMRTSGSSTKQVTSAMLLRIVRVTCEPISTAPASSKMTASTHAWRTVMAREPTLVAKALATSFAPMPNAAKKAAIPPSVTIHA